MYVTYMDKLVIAQEVRFSIKNSNERAIVFVVFKLSCCFTCFKMEVKCNSTVKIKS